MQGVCRKLGRCYVENTEFAARGVICKNRSALTTSEQDLLAWQEIQEDLLRCQNKKHSKIGCVIGICCSGVVLLLAFRFVYNCSFLLLSTQICARAHMRTPCFELSRNHCCSGDYSAAKERKKRPSDDGRFPCQEATKKIFFAFCH